MQANSPAVTAGALAKIVQKANASGRGDAVVATGTGVLVLLASFVNFLQYNEYPLLRQEVGIVAGSFVLLAALIGLVYAAADRPGRIALQILLVSLSFDLNFDGWAVGIGIAATVILVNRYIMPFTGIVAAVVLASAAAGAAFGTGSNSESTIPATARVSDAPPLLHLILDEHVGVEGLVGDAPRPTAMRQELKEFYVRKGFRLFGGAYSEYFHTVNSIPQVLNFATEQQWPGAGPVGMVISNNAYFDRLRKIGYRIAVYQTDFMKFCSDQSEHCRQYRQQDFAAIDDTELSAGEKAQLLAYGFAYLSRLTRVAAGLFDYASERLFRDHVDHPRFALGSRRRIDSIGATAIIDQLTRDLRNARSGEAFFAHLIIPHDPYALRADCSVKPTSDWLVRLSPEATRDETEQAYFDQITCLNNSLEGVFQALLSSEAGKEAIIIVHGDHGYRDAWPEPTVENLGHFSDADLVRGHSTLFAVRAPAIQSGYDARRLPISRLLGALAKSSFRNYDVDLPRDFKPSVVLGDRNWRAVVRHPLPAWWAKGGLRPLAGRHSNR